MTSCIDLLNNFSKIISELNSELTKNMLKSNVDYNLVCKIPALTFDQYYKDFAKKWDAMINNFVNNSDKCSSSIQTMLFLYDLQKNYNVKEIVKSELNKTKIEEFAIDAIINVLTAPQQNVSIKMDTNLIKYMRNFARILLTHCSCQLIDVFTYVIGKYKHRYTKKLEGKTKEESALIIKNDYERVKQMLRNYSTGKINAKGSIDINIMDFSIEAELQKLIPDDLGSLKQFFMKVIVRYFNNLHPIVWGQILKGIIDNIFIDLPVTPDEFFSFLSRQVLLNSGPFILKIIQMISPVLTEEQAKRYNLKDIKYPLLERNQVDSVLKDIVIRYETLQVFLDISASVGHVCLAYDVKDPNDVIVIKIIKPLAIAQSCWEYSNLHNLYEEGSCEAEYVKSILKSNGSELNVNNEIRNLDMFHKWYNTDYKTEYGIDIDAKLTTIENRRDILRTRDNSDPNAVSNWQALAVTFAPGIQLKELESKGLLKNDTRYRALLHRCLDLLVIKFFYTLVEHGEYHADLHAGNAFFSYEKKQITVIDFGSVGTLNMFDGSESTRQMIDIFLMSLMYNYDGMLTLLTDILNARCGGDNTIDKDSAKYKALENELVQYKIKNITNNETIIKNEKKYVDDVMSSKRINAEKNSEKIGLTDGNMLHKIVDSKKHAEEEPSIYDGLGTKRAGKEVIVENTEILPVFTEVVENKDNITFELVMKKIIEFYAESGVNVAVKFSEFFGFQKAYTLLLGTLYKTNYNSFRMNAAIKSSILNLGHFKKLFNVKTMYHIIAKYKLEESKLHKNMEILKSKKYIH